MATLTHACVITDDVAALRAFYERVLRMTPTRSHDDYVEFATARGALSLYARGKLEPYAPGATRPGSNRGGPSWRPIMKTGTTWNLKRSQVENALVRKN